MTPNNEPREAHEEAIEQEPEDTSEGSRRAFLNQALASSAALAGLGLLTHALGSTQAEAAEMPKAGPAILRGTPIKFRALANGVSLEVSSKELAQHMANEGVIDRKHGQGTATIRYDLTIID